MSRTGPGWCPFAEQIDGVTTFTEGGAERVGFCDHTAGGFYGTLKNAGFWNNAQTSVHFGISRQGEICQLVNIFDSAWAQGRDSRGLPVGPDSPGVTWPPFATMGRKNPNGYLISTEHEDYTLVHGQPTAVAGAEWTAEQYQADLKLKRWCVQEVWEHGGADLLRFGIDSLASHHMFDPVNRAQCCGPSWRNSYHQMLFDDLAAAPAPPRVWLYGNEVAGCEVRGNQLFYWHRGVEVDAVGDYEGAFPGAHYHNEGGNWRQVLP